MKPQVVSFRCVLRDIVGQVISTTINQEVLTQPGEGVADALPGLAKRMQDLRTGEKRRISLSAAEAYGFYNPELVLEASRRDLNSGSVRVGDQINVPSDAGGMRPFRVTKLSRQKVWLDGNHPLAGQDLVFDIEVTEARDATVEEIQDSAEPELPQAWMH